MSYVNALGQTVDVGCRVAYAGYVRRLIVGKVVSFTKFGSPRIELERDTVDMVRDRWNARRVYPKVSTANIWDVRPGALWRHTETGMLVPYADMRQESFNERQKYAYHGGILGSNWIEFKVPRVIAIVKRDTVVVIGERGDTVDSPKVDQLS